MTYTALVGLMAAAWIGVPEPKMAKLAAVTPARPLRPIVRVVQTAPLGIPQVLTRYTIYVYIAVILVAFPIPWSIWAVFASVRPFHAASIAIVVAGLWGVVLGRLLGLGTTAGLLLIPAGTMIVHLLALRAASFSLQRKHLFDSQWSEQDV
jgi:hypothetical protein